VIRGAQVERALAEWMRSPALILGIGNPLRGDDAVGPMICTLADSPLAVDCADAPERYLDLARDGRVGRVLLVDAVDFGGPPGEVLFCATADLTERFGTTHDSGLAVLARYIETEYRKPVAVLGVQPGDTRFGAEMSAAALAAVATVGEWLNGAISLQKQMEMEGAWTRS
jgi:hydrogenase maturation protease